MKRPATGMHPSAVSTRAKLLTPPTTAFGRWLDAVTDAHDAPLSVIAEAAGCDVSALSKARHRSCGAPLLRTVLSIAWLTPAEQAAGFEAWRRDVFGEVGR